MIWFEAVLVFILATSVQAHFISFVEVISKEIQVNIPGILLNSAIVATIFLIEKGAL